MFAKLLKYEFRSTKGILGLLTFVVLGVFLLATVALKLILVGTQSDSDLVGVAIAAGTPVLLMAILGIAAYGVASQILLVVQFYRSKFTDEGYLTFTLPTDVHRIYLASLTNMLIWQLITFVTIFVGIAVFVLFGTDPDHFVNTALFRNDFLPAISDFAQEEFSWDGLDALILVLRAILSLVSTVVLYTTCITVGSIISKKHKVLVAVAIYFAATSAMSTITSVVSMAVTLRADNLETAMTTVMDISGAMETAVSLIILIGGYILTTQMLKKKLNLA